MLREAGRYVHEKLIEAYRNDIPELQSRRARKRFTGRVQRESRSMSAAAAAAAAAALTAVSTAPSVASGSGGEALDSPRSRSPSVASFEEAALD